MKLWLLRPIRERKKRNAWEPWYDKAFGFVIRAETEQDARQLANDSGGDEVQNGHDPWLDRKQSTCVELLAKGKEENIIMDYARA